MGERILVILCIDVEPAPPSSRPYEGRAVVGLRATLALSARAPPAEGGSVRRGGSAELVLARGSSGRDGVRGCGVGAEAIRSGGRGDGHGGRRAWSASSCLAMGCGSPRMGA